MSRYHKSNFICDQSSNEDIPKQNLKYRHAEEPKKLNKSMSSPAFGNFRSVRRKQSEGFASSMENVFGRKTTTQQQQQTTTQPTTDFGFDFDVEKRDEKTHISKNNNNNHNTSSNNVSMSSSSGLDVPVVKNDKRKGRVSIQFKKKSRERDTGNKQRLDDDDVSSSTNTTRDKESKRGGRCAAATAATTSHRKHQTTSFKNGDKIKIKNKMDETDAATMSDRDERTNSVSSRTSSLVAASGSNNNARRKFSISSNRTYINDDKIPWCGCWGNGCV